jgi:hypothetical protein
VRGASETCAPARRDRSATPGCAGSGKRAWLAETFLEGRGGEGVDQQVEEVGVRAEVLRPLPERRLA